MIDETMGTFHGSKGEITGRSIVKSDDYENDFEEEPISDQVSEKIEEKEENAPEQVRQNSVIVKTAKFGDQNLLDSKRKESKTGIKE